MSWILRVSILVVAGLGVWATQGFWTTRIARSLICDEQLAPSDALLVENFDLNYLAFERAESLRQAGIATRILVPVLDAGNADVPNRVSKEIAEVMAEVARIPDIEVIPIRQIEPITLNAVNQIRDFLSEAHVRSIVAVTPGFRSRRSFLVYDALLTPAGITVRCVPVFGTTTPDNWTESWHGIQDVTLQFLKLQYYRFYVLL
jgi:hypothetical protein